MLTMISNKIMAVPFIYSLEAPLTEDNKLKILEGLKQSMFNQLKKYHSTP